MGGRRMHGCTNSTHLHLAVHHHDDDAAVVLPAPARAARHLDVLPGGHLFGCLCVCVWVRDRMGQGRDGCVCFVCVCVCLSGPGGCVSYRMSTHKQTRTHRKSFPSNLLQRVKTTVLAGMLIPMEKVSVAKRHFRRPSCGVGGIVSVCGRMCQSGVECLWPHMMPSKYVRGWMDGASDPALSTSFQTFTRTDGRTDGRTWKRISMISFKMGSSPPWWIPMPRLRSGRMDTTCGRVLSWLVWWCGGSGRSARHTMDGRTDGYNPKPPHTPPYTTHTTHLLGEGVDGVGEDLLHQLLLALLVEVQLGHLERVRLALPAASCRRWCWRVGRWRQSYTHKTPKGAVDTRSGPLSLSHTHTGHAAGRRHAPLGEGEDDDGVVVPLHDEPHDLPQVRLLALGACVSCVRVRVCVCVAGMVLVGVGGWMDKWARSHRSPVASINTGADPYPTPTHKSTHSPPRPFLGLPPPSPPAWAISSSGPAWRSVSMISFISRFAAGRDGGECETRARSYQATKLPTYLPGARPWPSGSCPPGSATSRPPPGTARRRRRGRCSAVVVGLGVGGWVWKGVGGRAAGPSCT